MVEVSGSGGGQEDDLLSQRPAKYRPHRPHRRKYCNFQDFRAVGTITGHRPPVDRYRAPRQVPTAYRPRGNLLFSRSFSWVMAAAVGAGEALGSSSAPC